MQCVYIYTYMKSIRRPLAHCDPVRMDNDPARSLLLENPAKLDSMREHLDYVIVCEAVFILSSTTGALASSNSCKTEFIAVDTADLLDGISDAVQSIHVKDLWTTSLGTSSRYSPCVGAPVALRVDLRVQLCDWGHLGKEAVRANIFCAVGMISLLWPSHVFVLPASSVWA